MSFSVGIIGLPNVGKSTLFKALTKKQVDISNYPFCTIDPNVGTVKVPDQRLDKLAQILNPKQILPTYIEFVDIAGLVKGAHQGEGLGNQFLSHIREVDALIEIVRSFTDTNITHVSGKIDPPSDIETIKLELIFADLASVEKRLTKIKKETKNQSKIALKITEILEKIKKTLTNGRSIRELNLTAEENKLIADLNLLTSKPIIHVFNIDEKSIGRQTNNNNRQIHLCAKLEAELADLSPEETKEYLKEYGQNSSALDTLIISAYKKLNLITFFTAQNQILQAWTIPFGTKAPKAAAKIHTDLAQGFIRAEVINWHDLIKAGSIQNARETGQLRIEGKDYIIKNGEIIHFKFNS